jgi:hypothetical protein
VEWTRVSTLGLGGFQQLQVDLAALHLALPYFVTSPAAASSAAAAASASSSAVSGPADPYASAGPLEELVNEAAVSAAERCVEPRPLEASIIHTICAPRLARINLSI